MATRSMSPEKLAPSACATEAAQSPLWHLKCCPLFSKLTDVELGEVFRASRVIPLGPNSEVPSASDEAPALWVVKRGYVSMKLMDEEGRQITVSILEPGDLFGALAPGADERYGEFCRTVTEVCLCRIPLDEFHHLLVKYPGIAFTLAKAGIDRVHRLQVRLADMLMRPVESRLAYILIELNRTLGASGSDGEVALPIRFSHMELAQLAGSSREMITHVLRRFSKHNLVRSERQQITLLDLEGLELVCDDKFEWTNT